MSDKLSFIIGARLYDRMSDKKVRPLLFRTASAGPLINVDSPLTWVVNWPSPTRGQALMLLRPPPPPVWSTSREGAPKSESFFGLAWVALNCSGTHSIISNLSSFPALGSRRRTPWPQIWPGRLKARSLSLWLLAILWWPSASGICHTLAATLSPFPMPLPPRRAHTDRASL